jgi:hypothetical protein
MLHPLGRQQQQQHLAQSYMCRQSKQHGLTYRRTDSNTDSLKEVAAVADTAAKTTNGRSTVCQKGHSCVSVACDQELQVCCCCCVPVHA